ncbi:MAG: NAD(P)H-hydrate dehydratase, partial [Candidatus Thorarchaeota archaeon]
RVIEQNDDVSGKHVVILCGPGGNGGDGMVAARHLQESGATVEVYLIGSEESITSPDTMFNWGILKNLREIRQSTLKTESAVKSCNAIIEADIVIDAILGFGVKSKLREPVLTAVKIINKSQATKYAVDVPTGVDADTGKIHSVAVIADHTITLHAIKVGLLITKEYTGKLHVVPIGIPPEAARTCGPGDLWIFNRPRPMYSHKGDFGRVLIIGGSDVYSGAPALTGLAALRTGADLVHVLAPEPVVSAIRAYGPNLMVHSLNTPILQPESVNMILDLAGTCDVVAIGPGLGIHQETQDATRLIIQELTSTNIPLVVDADALKAIPGSELCFNSSNSILTPHWGELSIIIQESLGKTVTITDLIKKSAQAAEKYKAVILLKGAVDVISAGVETYKLNRTGVPAMTVGGTGDVLTGITAALLARHEDGFRAASAAAFVSGLAGTLAFQELGDHLTATDCIAKIPDAMDPN